MYILRRIILLFKNILLLCALVLSLPFIGLYFILLTLFAKGIWFILLILAESFDVFTEPLNRYEAFLTRATL